MDRDPLVGTRLGEHYMIEECVGEGAIGRVYRARHQRLEHRVFAVKVMLGDWATTMSMRMRFAQEAETASRLAHPNVVSVVDFGRTEEGLLYLAMEYVEGRSLATLIDEDGPLSAGRTIALARQMCLGLSYAHAQGLVHRDFKPDNVLVIEAEGRETPRIADFGLAISEENDRDVRLTAVGIAVGTPTYAAPEQTSGDTTIDHRADLFSLGVTLYEMLAGRAPFDGNLVELLRHNASGKAPSIAERSGRVVPPGLEQIVKTLMAPDPANRFPTALAVIEALDRIDPSAATDVVALAPPPGRARRRAGVVIAGALVAGTAIAAFALQASEPRPTPAPVATVRSPAPASALAQSPTSASSGATAQSPTSASSGATAQPSNLAATAPAPGGRMEPEDSTPRAMQRPPSRSPSRAPSPRTAREMTTTSTTMPSMTTTPRPPATTPPTAPTTATTPPAGSAGLQRAPMDVPQDAGTTEPVPARAPVRAPAPPPIALGPPSVDLTDLNVAGSLPGSVVRRTIARIEPAIEACYGMVARKTGSELTADTLRVELVIDETGALGRVQIGGGASPAAATCIADVLRRTRTNTPPDVGTVEVSFTLAMRRVPR